jgi:hypothetical protein
VKCENLEVQKKKKNDLSTIKIINISSSTMTPLKGLKRKPSDYEPDKDHESETPSSDTSSDEEEHHGDTSSDEEEHHGDTEEK